MFIKKYKVIHDVYEVYGYIKKDLIVNIFTALGKKNFFEVRALLQGDTNAQTIFYGSKKECLEFMAKFAENDVLPEPSGEQSGSSKEEA